MDRPFDPARRTLFAIAGSVMAAPALLRVAQAASTEAVTIEIENGKLRGTRENGVVSFRGIPYADSTSGANRFMPPQPVRSWTGIRDAVDFGDRCVQPAGAGEELRAYAFTWYSQTGLYSENCCALNVFAPDLEPNAKRPVMVYIHGGGYITGSVNSAVLDGSNLAKSGDVVVVTVNHRLNAFGYTSLSHLDAEQFGDAANAGQLDLIAALLWVRRNIAAFSGDPGNVTIFGQSGGGSKVVVLMGMPEATGLFHKVIDMSGVSGFGVATAASTEAYVNELLKQLGIDKSNLHKLRTVPADAILAGRAAAVVATSSVGGRPVVDGRHIPGGSMEPQALPLHASVPLMMGTANTEATWFFNADKRNFHVTAEQVKARIRAQFNLDDAGAETVMAEYRASDPSRTPADILAFLATDNIFRLTMLRGIEPKVRAGQAPVYLYNFVWKAPVEDGIWRSPHTIDIPFAFGNTDVATHLTGSGPDPKEVARSLMSAFVAFAHTGDPNNSRMPQWLSYDLSRRPTMTIDVDCKLVDDFRGADRIASSKLRMDPFNRDALVTYRD